MGFSLTFYRDPKANLGCFPGGSDGKESVCNAGARVLSLGQEDPLEKGMATHSSIIAWRIPWTEEPGGLQSRASHGVRHAWVANTFILHTLLFYHGLWGWAFEPAPRDTPLISFLLLTSQQILPWETPPPDRTRLQTQEEEWLLISQLSPITQPLLGQ